MSERRRVLGSTPVAAAKDYDTPTRGVRASPMTGVRAIINNTGTASPSVYGSSPGSGTPAAATPVARASVFSKNAPSPSASAAVLARARVLGYDHQQESTSNGSPLAASGAKQRAGPSTPGASSSNGPITPVSTNLPSSSSYATSSASAARAPVNPIKATFSGQSSSAGVGVAARKVRATSTPPYNDSPTASRPVSRPASPKRRAFPAFGGETDQRSSSPSGTLGQSTQATRMPRVRPISGVRSNTAAPGSLPRADPVKPPIDRSKSMTARPASATASALLPSPTIRATPSSIFASSSSATSAPTARSKASVKPGSRPGQSPSSPSRPLSPVRQRPASPLRPASPRRGEPFRPTSALAPSSPRRPGSSTAFGSHSPVTSISPPIVSATAKRPSTSSASSSSIHTADTSNTTNTTTTTAPTCFSPELMLSDSNEQQAQLASLGSRASTSTNGYHRTRRRSHSTSSSFSSTSGLSNVSKTKALPAGSTTRHSRTGSASLDTNVAIGIGIKIPNISSPQSSLVGFSTSPQQGGSLASPHRQTPISPGRGFFSEAEQMEQQAHLDAKVHRKILDLEITNTSLLAINASLEKAKAKQSAEIRTLRRQIRDRTSFAPLSSSNLLSPLSDDFAWNPSIPDEEDEQEMTWDDILVQDEKFADMVRLLDSMNRRGKEALEKTTKSEEKSLGGPKVLNHFDIPGSSNSVTLGLSKNSLKSTIGSGSDKTSLKGSSSARSQAGESTIEPDTTTSDTETEAETTDQSNVQDTSRTSSNQLESSDGDASLTSSSFDISRGMASNSEFSISID